MSEKRRNKSSGRNYKGDTAYESSPEQVKKREQRNKARRKLEKEGRVHKGDGKDVDHKGGLGKGNSDSNLRAISKAKNRGYKRNSDHTQKR